MSDIWSGKSDKTAGPTENLSDRTHDIELRLVKLRIQWYYRLQLWSQHLFKQINTQISIQRVPLKWHQSKPLYFENMIIWKIKRFTAVLFHIYVNYPCLTTGHFTIIANAKVSKIVQNLKYFSKNTLIFNLLQIRSLPWGNPLWHPYFISKNKIWLSFRTLCQNRHSKGTVIFSRSNVVSKKVTCQAFYALSVNLKQFKLTFNTLGHQIRNLGVTWQWVQTWRNPEHGNRIFTIPYLTDPANLWERHSSFWYSGWLLHILLGFLLH